jgi:hypothetical protein
MISSDWTGNTYCGLKLEWYYVNGTFDLSMPGYIKAALHKYQNPAHIRAEHAPYKWNSPVYGAKTQYVEDRGDNPDLSPKDVDCLQQLGGTLLYYARAVKLPSNMEVMQLCLPWRHKHTSKTLQTRGTRPVKSTTQDPTHRTTTNTTPFPTETLRIPGHGQRPSMQYSKMLDIPHQTIS